MNSLSLKCGAGAGGGRAPGLRRWWLRLPLGALLSVPRRSMGRCLVSCFLCGMEGDALGHGVICHLTRCPLRPRAGGEGGLWLQLRPPGHFWGVGLTRGRALPAQCQVGPGLRLDTASFSRVALTWPQRFCCWHVQGWGGPGHSPGERGEWWTPRPEPKPQFPHGSPGHPWLAGDGETRNARSQVKVLGKNLPGRPRLLIAVPLVQEFLAHDRHVLVSGRRRCCCLLSPGAEGPGATCWGRAL